MTESRGTQRQPQFPGRAAPVTRDTANKDWLARIIALGGLVVALVTGTISVRTYIENKESQTLTRRLQACELLDKAFDLIADSRGATVVYLKTGPMTEEESQRYELARRDIERAIELAPDFYLGHEYYGLLLRRQAC